jgi:hypothetical protein
MLFTGGRDKVTERDIKMMRVEWNRAFGSYLEQGGESARTAARELGRQFVESGMPLREMLNRVMGTMGTAARTPEGHSQIDRVIAAGESFMFDCAVPYDEATILDDLGLVPALHELSRTVGQNNGLVLVVEGPMEERFSPAIEIALYRTVQEALTSAGKHSHAHRVKVKIQSTENEIRCSIADDGGGLMGRSSATNRGPVLIGIRERLAALGGTLVYENRPDGRGAQLTASIPLEVSHVTTRFGR